MQKSRYIIITLLVLLLFGVAIYHNYTKKRILVIHSYNTDFAWVNQVNGGITDYISTQKKDPKTATLASSVIIDFYYMDLQPASRKNCQIYRSAIQDAEKLIAERRPEVIIIVDDIAQRLVGLRYIKFKEDADAQYFYQLNADWLAKDGKCADTVGTDQSVDFFNLHYVETPTQPAIIFAGINNDVIDYGYYEAENVTGIFEHKYMEAILETLEDIFNAIPIDAPKPTNVVILSDKSATSSAENPRFESKLMSLPFHTPLEWGDIKSAENFEEWKALVQQANTDQSMIFFANYTGIKHNAETDADVVKWTETNALFPVLGGSTNFVRDGGMLTVTVPGSEQGSTAIELALQALENKSTASIISMREPQQFVVGMNMAMIRKRALLNFPLIYQSFSKESNNYVDEDYTYNEP